MNLRTTYTVVELEVSKECFEEIERKLRDADYDHAFVRQEERFVIDMHGIGLVKTEEPPEK